MADFLKEAIEMVKAQASLKEMTPEQTMDLVKKYQQSFLALANIENKDLMEGTLVSGTPALEEKKPIEFMVEPKVAIKKGQPDLVTCAICGFQARTLARHIKNTHGMTPKEYKAICGYASTVKLTAKSFSEARSEWAKDNKPYEKSARYQKAQEKKAEFPEEVKPSKKAKEQA